MTTTGICWSDEHQAFTGMVVEDGTLLTVGMKPSTKCRLGLMTQWLAELGKTAASCPICTTEHTKKAHTMTLQEIFNKVATHLLTQKVKSFGSDAGCLYRGPNGTSCAVGCLIKEEHYDPEIEGEAAVAIPVRLALSASGIPTTDETLSLLSELQLLHDESQPEAWPTDLAELAQELGLEYTQ